MQRKTGRTSAPAGTAGKARTPLAAPVFGARAVGAFLPKVTGKVFEKYGFSAAAVLTDWPAIVGADLASYTVPERLTWPRKRAAVDRIEDGSKGRPGATLVLRVDGSRALDLHYRGQQIVERINGYFGYRAVTELRFLQGPVAALDRPETTKRTSPRPLTARSSPEIAAIADQRLRDALAWMHGGVCAVWGRGNGSNSLSHTQTRS
jgi:hypothetical protein